MDGNNKERRTVKKGKRAGLKIPTLQAPEALIDMKERIPEYFAGEIGDKEYFNLPYLII